MAKKVVEKALKTAVKKKAARKAATTSAKKAVKKAAKKAASQVSSVADRVAYQLKVTLQDVRPPIWRRLLVPRDLRLDDLHEVIQIAMGWENYHMHQFEKAGVYFGAPDPEFADMDVRDERQVRLDELLRVEKDWIGYEYDFGDGWRHRIELEAIRPTGAGEPLPVCLAGRRACPPEDSGGPWGYQELLQAIADPEHPEREERLEWVGEGFDPEHFDPADVDDALRRHLG